MAIHAECEITTEDLLLLHKGWIKNLIDDGKSDADVLTLLHERNLFVTLQQIQECLQNSDLDSINTQPETDIHVSTSPTNQLGAGITLASSKPKLSVDTNSTGDSWELIQSNDCQTASFQLPPDSPTYTHSPTADPESETLDLKSRPAHSSPTSLDFEPDAIDLYKSRPLPSIPSTSAHKRKSSATLQRPAKDRLKFTCYHGPQPYEIEMSLGIFARRGPSPIETYASDDQKHERIAVGLKRAGQRTFGRGPEVRVERRLRMTKRRDGKPRTEEPGDSRRDGWNELR